MNSISCLLFPLSRSPASYHLLFGNESIPPSPTPLSDIAFIFDIKNERSDTLEKAVTFPYFWTDSLLSIMRHLEYVLAYAARSTLACAVSHCWRRFDDVLQAYLSAICRISEDPRYDHIRYHPRPAGAVSNLILDTTDLLRFECSCYRRISRCKEAHHLMRQSRERLLDMLTLLSQQLTLLYVSMTPFLHKLLKLTSSRQRVSNEPRQLHSAGVTFVENIRSCPEDILRDWASLSPLKSEQYVISQLRALFCIADVFVIPLQDDRRSAFH